MTWESICRYALVRLLSSPLELYILNEYPKSGGTWVGQMLASALGVPFPRNERPRLRSSVIHCHYLSPWGINRPIVVWRDGRDIMVSWYYYTLFLNERNNQRQVASFRKAMPFHDYDDIRTNLPVFIELSFTRQPYPRFSWSDFVHRWYDRPGVIHTRYEEMQQNAVAEMRRVFSEITGEELATARAEEIVDNYSFARQAGRNPGQEDKASFLRKGIVGDWRNHFSREACEIFQHHAGEAMTLLGYERDDSWIGQHVASIGNQEVTEELPRQDSNLRPDG